MARLKLVGETADEDGLGLGVGLERRGIRGAGCGGEAGGGQVRVVGLCSRIYFRTAMEYPSIHVLFPESLPAFFQRISLAFWTYPSIRPISDFRGRASSCCGISSGKFLRSR